MKKVFIITLMLGFILLSQGTAAAYAQEEDSDFSTILEEHGVAMLILDPQNGDIRYVNKAASELYGYSKETFLSMNISQINMLSPEEISVGMEAASEENRNHFIFKHQLANGSVHTMEVYSYPAIYEGKVALFSIVYDITEKLLLQERQKNVYSGILITGAIVIFILSLLLMKLKQSQKKLERSKNELDNFNLLRKTFIDADKSVVYLKDENLNYVFVNRAFEEFFHKKSADIVGYDDSSLEYEEFTQRFKETDLAVLAQGRLIADEGDWEGRTYRFTKFPVAMLNGSFGVGVYQTDITEEKELEKKQKKALYRHMLLADVLTRSFESKEAQLDYVLHQALELTESLYGYIYLYDEEKRRFTLNSWTKDVMEACSVVEKKTVYQLDKTGIWGEAVRQRKPIIVNDFEAENPLKKGYPKGHVTLKKFMSIPVVIDERIVAVVGFANKESDYDDNDIYEMTLLMSGVWNGVERREAQEKLTLERNKYLQTLISIGDAVLVVDKKGMVEMLNDVAQRLTGWPISEAYGKHYKEVFVLSHEQEGMAINDPIEEVFEVDGIRELGNHAILTSKEGKRYNLEDSAAPIKDDKNNTVGVVLIFRDVTDKKEQRRRIEYLSFHDSLTGLYNRRFFENELKRLDIEENLPLSIIMGDVDGLKLTNDIFGHAFGDIFLEKAADVLRRASRTGDVIARWGGDEFVLLLKKTDAKEAKDMIGKIKDAFSKERIKAIKGGISLGSDTKTKMAENITEVLYKAEEKMYSAKSVDRSEASSSVIDTIMDTIHENNPEETEHFLRVSELSQRLGKALSLPDVDLRKLKEAGYLHDIGKIVTDFKVMGKDRPGSRSDADELCKHAVVGYRILNSFDNTADLAEIVLNHHERWDGKGYPKGLRGEEIPILSRIISIANHYDGMIRGRAYQEALTEEEAIGRILEHCGTQFDQRIARVFVEAVVPCL